MSDGSDSIFHRPLQRPAAIPETLPPSVQSPREILALCFSTFHNSACPQYTLSPIMSIRLDKKITLGGKLNLACEYARGDIIAHWDDDDWYALHRLSYQVQALVPGKVDVCGLSRLLYYDLQSGRAHKYVYPPGQHIWLLGSELCYFKAFWATHRFADIQVGMDTRFVWSADPRRVVPLTDCTFAVHMIHAHNVSPKRPQGACWHPHAERDIEQLLGEDWRLYSGPSRH